METYRVSVFDQGRSDGQGVRNQDAESAQAAAELVCGERLRLDPKKLGYLRAKAWSAADPENITWFYRVD